MDRGNFAPPTIGAEPGEKFHTADPWCLTSAGNFAPPTIGAEPKPGKNFTPQTLGAQPPGNFAPTASRDLRRPPPRNHTNRLFWRFLGDDTCGGDSSSRGFRHTTHSRGPGHGATSRPTTRNLRSSSAPPGTPAPPPETPETQTAAVAVVATAAAAGGRALQAAPGHSKRLQGTPGGSTCCCFWAHHGLTRGPPRIF